MDDFFWNFKTEKHNCTWDLIKNNKKQIKINRDPKHRFGSYNSTEETVQKQQIFEQKVFMDLIIRNSVNQWVTATSLLAT